MKADFTANLSDIEVKGFKEEKEIGFIPVSIEELDPKNTPNNFQDDTVVNSVLFTSNPFEPEFQQKPNPLKEDGFEKGRLVWSFNYKGADIHIYYKLFLSSNFYF